MITVIVTSAMAAALIAGCSSKPSVPEAPIDLVKSNMTTGTNSVNGEKVGTTRIVTPHASAHVIDRRLVEEITKTDASLADLPFEEGLKAAEGQELMLADMALDKAPYPIDKASPTYLVRAGTTVRQIGSLVAPDASAFAHLIVAFSVTKGEPAAFGISDEGRTSWIDLRTGKLIEDSTTRQSASFATSKPSAIFADAPASRTKQLFQDYVDGEFTTNPIVFTFVTSKWTLLRLPWVPGLGWAPKGTDWLVLGNLDVKETTPFSLGTRPIVMMHESIKVQVGKVSAGPRSTDGMLGYSDFSTEVPSATYTVPHGPQTITLVMKPTYLISSTKADVASKPGPEASTVRISFQLF